MTPAAWLALAALTAAPAPAPAAPPPDRILVMPFENATRDSRIFWLSEASAVLLADDLNALGAHAIARDERRQAFDRLQVPPAAVLTDATVIRIGQLVGAARVVVGTLEMTGDTLTIRARSIVLEAGKVQASVVERGPASDLFATIERVARRIAPATAVTDDAIARQQPPLAAFERFIKGVLADTPATGIGYLNDALKLYPPFDRARLALWDIYEEQGDHEQALAAVTPVAADSPWAFRARFRAGLAQLQLKNDDAAFATFKALADRTPSAAVLNDLGVVQLRRGSTPESGRATFYFTKATDADPADPDYCFNLGYAYWIDRDTQAAIYWLREAVRRNPADGDAHFVLGTALSAAGNGAEAAREKELARRLSSTYGQWEKRPSTEPVPMGLERLKSDVELPHGQGLVETLAAGEPRDQRDLAAFYLDRGRRLFEQERDREAAIELNRAVFLSPYLADAHLLLGRIHLRNGRVREAIDAFKIALWSHESVAAHVALGEAYLQAKDPDAARDEAERALALDPASAEAKRLLERAGPREGADRLGPAC